MGVAERVRAGVGEAGVLSYAATDSTLLGARELDAPESGWSWTAIPANPAVRSLAMDRAGNVYIASDNRLDKLTANNGIYAHDVRPLADGLNAIAALPSNDGVAYIFDAGDGIYAGVIVYDDPVDSN